MYKIHIQSICSTESKVCFVHTHAKNTLSCPHLIAPSKSYQATIVHHFGGRKVEREIRIINTPQLCPLSSVSQVAAWTAHRMVDPSEDKQTPKLIIPTRCFS